MPEEVEIEFKNLLTRAEFAFLRETFDIKSNEFFSQINHYFDTPGFSLKENRAALRIRQLNGRCELTLKRKTQKEALETNQSIEPSQADLFFNADQLPEGEVKEALLKMEIPTQTLTYFGSLTTHRAEVNYKDGLLVLDHSCYLDQEDFELEYEANDYEKGKAIFKDLLNQLNIPLKTSDTKIGRFYKAKFLEMIQKNED